MLAESKETTLRTNQSDEKFSKTMVLVEYNKHFLE